LRRFFRTIACVGQHSDVWPVALVLVAVLVPAVCLLWFMGAAMRNERFAARQTLADAYRVQLLASRDRVEGYLNQTSLELEKLTRASSPPVGFARCIQSGLVDSVVLFNEQGQVIYPNQPVAPATTAIELEAKWAEAGQLENGRKDFVAAAKLYSALAAVVTNVNQRARALQAQARCLVRAAEREAAAQLVNNVLSRDQYNRALDPQGRLIVANAELMVLELTGDKPSPAFDTTAQRLKQRLMDYENPMLASPQRRFLMKELRKRSAAEFPTLAAEELAAQFCEHGTATKVTSSMSRAPVPNTWQLATPNGQVMALMLSDKLIKRLETIASTEGVGGNAKLTLEPPGIESGATFVSVAAGGRLPGWRLAVSFEDAGRLDAATKHRATIYLWIGVLLIAGMGVLTLLAVRLLRRQTALARLKNDLAATVSHELKTPLAAMRVLVDTLLNSKESNEQTTREYLQLIAQENERLSRLIQNFLTFSRMERKKHTFLFSPLPAGEIIDATVGAVRERFQAPGCSFEAQIDPDLPIIMCDRDALAAALINLLDNAWKYSGDIKHIVLRARSQSGKVIFSVQDNGIGIARSQNKRIFQSFYQIDQRLSRAESGCGLGLSIVQFITIAHRGDVSVASEPGRGSTFTIALPVAAAAVSLKKEALA
jgi:signal transduction histidine kinase